MPSQNEPFCVQFIDAYLPDLEWSPPNCAYWWTSKWRILIRTLLYNQSAYSRSKRLPRAVWCFWGALLFSDWLFPYPNISSWPRGTESWSEAFHLPETARLVQRKFIRLTVFIMWQQLPQILKIVLTEEMIFGYLEINLNVCFTYPCAALSALLSWCWKRRLYWRCKQNPTWSKAKCILTL